MGFGQAISTCYKKFFTFSGRATRSEYWWFQLFAFLVGIGIFVLAIIAAAAMAPSDDSGGFEALGGFIFVLIIGGLIALIALGIPALAVTVRRLHDMGQPGWWVGVNYAINCLTIPMSFSENGSSTSSVLSLLGSALGIGIFVMTILPSQPKDNKYGLVSMNAPAALGGSTPPPPPSGYTPLS